MNSLNRKNERKHKVYGVIYTAIFLGLMIGLFSLSGQADGLKDRLLEFISPTEESTTTDKAPVAALPFHRGGNG